MIRLLLLSFCCLFMGIDFANAKKDRLPLPNPYVGSVQRIIDGDTIIVNVKLWPTLTAEVPVRVDGINVPERRDNCKGAIQMSKNSKSFLQQIMPPGTQVKLYNVRKGKYTTRIVARVEYKVNTSFKKLTPLMLKKRLACPYEGGSRRNWCNPTFNPCWK